MPTNMLTTSSTAIVEASPVAETTQLVQNETPEVFEPTPFFGNAPVQVYVVANQRAWMQITVDGEIVFEGRTVPGSAYTYAGYEQVMLLTGNGGGLQVYFNQQDMGLLGAFGEVVERVFSIQGVLTATPRVLPTNTLTPTGTPTPTGTSTGTSTPATTSATPLP
jgi:hypothetical protein